MLNQAAAITPLLFKRLLFQSTGGTSRERDHALSHRENLELYEITGGNVLAGIGRYQLFAILQLQISRQ